MAGMAFKRSAVRFRLNSVTFIGQSILYNMVRKKRRAIPADNTWPTNIQKKGCRMHYIFFDLEWNQPTDARSIVQEPGYLNGEVTEIGAVKLDAHFCPVDELRIYVKPQHYIRMHQDVVILQAP